MRRPKFGTDWTPPAETPRQLDAFEPELFDGPISEAGIRVGTALLSQDADDAAEVAGIVRELREDLAAEADPETIAVEFTPAEVRQLVSWLDWMAQGFEPEDTDEADAGEIGARFARALNDHNGGES